VDWRVQVPRQVAAVAKPDQEKPSDAREWVPVDQSDAAAAVTTQPAPVEAPAESPKDPILQKALGDVNAVRADHRVPALKWDSDLAASAAKFVKKCPVTRSKIPSLGETLALGSSNFSAALKDWVKQGRKYNYKQPGWRTSTGMFSQLVWAGTSRVGCAYNTDCTWAAYVCHFDPPGECWCH
jgi:hypothetical protein